jgi:hypothetical protein
MSLTNLLLCILLSLLLILAIVYLLVFQNKTTTFTTTALHNPYNQYLNNAIYSMPGTIDYPYMLYGSGYMPYESAVPAIDVLRAGSNNSRIPAYYKQYLEKNITPFTKRNTNTI